MKSTRSKPISTDRSLRETLDDLLALPRDSLDIGACGVEAIIAAINEKIRDKELLKKLPSHVKQ